MISDKQIARLLDICNLATYNGMIIQARTICDGILAMKPNFAPALISLAFSHIVVDDYSKGQDILDMVLESNPEDYDALGMLAMSHILSGDRVKAESEIARLPEDSLAGVMARSFMNAS